MTPAEDPAVDLLERLAVVLFRPKHPENVGAVGRACLNMGCKRIILVDPRNYDHERALPLATVHAEHLLEQAVTVPDLSQALGPFTQVYGTTARLGGRRKTLLTPAQAAARIVEQLLEGHEVALVFGPEDRGLTNAEIEACSHLISIPTARSSVSLNLAQAVLVLLYECLQAARRHRKDTPIKPRSDHVTHAEQEALFSVLQKLLTTIDFIPQDNPDYWMLRLRRFWHRKGLHRDEYNVLMGVCRQMNWALGKRENGEG
ncbi:RNA methyltransferase [Desulfonatronum parangueonense]